MKNKNLTEICHAEIVEAKSLTLDEIEARMIAIVDDDSDDVIKSMINEKKISMLEKVANLKLKRLQLKALEEGNRIDTVEPITIKFVSSNTEEQKARIERIDSEILNTGKRDA